MNSKLIAVVIVVVILVVGGVYFINKKNASQTNMQHIPQQTQQQAQTSPSGSQQATTAKNAVTIQNFSFSPATLTVKKGDEVTWTNQDSAGHSATADDNSFDTGVLSQGQSKSITFSKAGTYTYYCNVHPNMKATIIVQ